MQPLSSEFLRYFLPVFFALYFGFCFVWRTVSVWRRTGINPLVLGKSDNVYDYIGKWFKATILMAGVSVAIFVISDDAYRYLVPIEFMERAVLRATGLFLLIFSFPWTFLAQVQMGNSWRIGIDQRRKSELVAFGMFRYSRNPIFLGMIMTIMGLFLVLPNALTLIVLVLGFVLIQLQVRLEEEYLTRVQGITYLQYCREVRRWL